MGWKIMKTAESSIKRYKILARIKKIQKILSERKKKSALLVCKFIEVTGRTKNQQNSVKFLNPLRTPPWSSSFATAVLYHPVIITSIGHERNGCIACTENLKSLRPEATTCILRSLGHLQPAGMQVRNATESSHRHLTPDPDGQPHRDTDSLFVWLWLIVNNRKFLVRIVFFSHTNQPAVLFHEPATIRTSQPNRPVISTYRAARASLHV